MSNFTEEERQKYKELDRIFVSYDKLALRRTKNLRLIPNEPYRRGGKYAYSEWAFTIGVFQTLLNIHLPKKENNNILDVGCGTGLMCIAAEPFLGSRGHCVGIDAVKSNIHFCRKNFPDRHFSFLHPDRRSTENRMLWDVEDNTFDLITALSVWTHFDEETAKYYFCEVNRMLKKGGIALISFFYLDELYHNSFKIRDPGEIGRYHSTNQGTWLFNQPVNNSENWFCPSWSDIPERAIGITYHGMAQMMGPTFLILNRGNLLAPFSMKGSYYPGNWKEHPGIFFQDVMVFEKV